MLNPPSLSSPRSRRQRRPIERPFLATAGLCLLATYVLAPSGAGALEPDPARHGFSLIPERPGSAFVDATSTHVPTAPSLHSTDAVFTDVDADGDLDVAVSVEHGVNRLYLNQGDGRLVYQPEAFGTVMHDNEHVRSADFNGDGHPDVVFVSEADETHQLYLGDGRGGFSDASDRLPAMSQGNGLEVGDLNGDGLADIFIGSTGEAGHGSDQKEARNLLFLNDPARPGRFIDVSSTHLPQGDDQTEGVAFADIDADGDLDILLASPSHPNRLLINDGSGRFRDASDRLDLSVPMETREVKAFDANGDGLVDIVYFIITSNNRGWEKDPQTRLLIQTIDGRFEDETEKRLPHHDFSSWAGAVVDFDGDGALDLIVGAIQVPGFVPMQPRAWRNNGDGFFEDVTLEALPGVTVGRSWSMGVGDLDGVNAADIFIGGWGTQARLLLSDIRKHQGAQEHPLPFPRRRPRCRPLRQPRQETIDYVAYNRPDHRDRPRKRRPKSASWIGACLEQFCG